MAVANQRRPKRRPRPFRGARVRLDLAARWFARVTQLRRPVLPTAERPVDPLSRPFLRPAELAALAGMPEADINDRIAHHQIAAVARADGSVLIPRQSVLLLVAPERAARPVRMTLDEMPLHPD